MKIYLILSILLLSKVQASEVFGYYSEGSLLNAQSVSQYGTPVKKLFVARARLYTSDEMHEVLTDASHFVRENFPESEIFQVGDLSAKNGGEVLGHASHQNGLDADVVYLRRNKYVQSSESTNWDEDFVSKSAPTSNFNTERNFALFKFLVKSTPISRIFVDASIKKNLCQFAVLNGEINQPLTIETLRRLRPQDLHRTHFHIRISCPVNDYECRPQTEPASGSGCDDLSIMLDLARNYNSC